MMLGHSRLHGPEARPERWLLYLPGIYGQGRNWASVARRLMGERPDWGSVLVDLREHGESTGFPPPHTLAAAAADVAALTRSLGIARSGVLGHSFGGKVALVHARAAPAELEQVWVVDSAPGAHPPGGSAWEMLVALRDAPARFEARGDGVRALEDRGVAAPVAQWMATNLARGDDEVWRWGIDPEAMEALLVDFFRTDAWDVIEEPPPGTHVHVVKAEGSSVLDEDACARVEAAGSAHGRAFLHRVPGGHWVNADSPDALTDLLSGTLPR